jgi:hypothetical protein
MEMAGREPTVSDEEILNVFREAADPVLTTAEVAEAIELGRRGTLDRLKQLSNENHLTMKKVGETSAVWWYPEGLSDRYQ